MKNAIAISMNKEQNKSIKNLFAYGDQEEDKPKKQIKRQLT